MRAAVAPDWPLAGGIAAGVLADAVVGDPRRGHPVALFPDEGMTWHHYRGTADASGDHKAVDPGHEPKVEWYLPDEIPADF